MHPHDQRKKDDTLLAVQIYLHDPFGNLLVLTLSTGGHIEVISENEMSRSLFFIVILAVMSTSFKRFVIASNSYWTEKSSFK